MRFSYFVLGLFVIVASLSCGSGDPVPEKAGQTQMALQPSGTLTYMPHGKWIEEKPQSNLRKSQYKMPGLNGADDGELAVFYFQGTGGSVEDNLKRWYSQFKQIDGSNTETQAQRREVRVKDLAVTVVYATGTYLQSASGMMVGPVEEKPDYAMLAAIVPTSAGPWFFKATGPRKTIDFWRGDFDAFVRTFRVK